MTPYSWIALVAFIGLIVFPSKMGKVRNTAGSVMLAIAWPAILVMLAYYGLKKLVGYSGVSHRYGDVEALLCMFVGCLLVPVALYLQPFATQLVHSIWG